MAAQLEILLRDVRVFLEKLDAKDLPASLRDDYEALIARLRQAERPSYLDMNGARKLRNTLSGSECMSVYKDVHQSSTDCSVCLDNSADEWPPTKCARPDLSPDWAVSARAASERAVLSGPVFRSGPGGPGPLHAACRWLRLGLRRRAWAALLSQPSCRLLVYASPRASRPRLVLQLGAEPPCGPGAPCCAVYSARPRPRPEGLALELCCPGRKTHQIWFTEETEVNRWMEAIRRTSHPESPDSSTSPLTTTSVTSLPDQTPSPVVAPPAEKQQGSDCSVYQPRSTSVSRASDASESLNSVTEELSPPLDNQDQQQYESMLSGNEEIYHDIAPATSENPNYVNLTSSTHSTPEDKSVTSDETDMMDSPARPLYDDIIVPPKAPEYCNLSNDSILAFNASDEEKVGNEHLYDDIGSIGPQTSVYERIQDPMANHGICCS